MNEDLTTGDKVKTKEEFKFKKRGKINKKEEKEIRRTQKSLTSWLTASRRKDNINTDMDVMKTLKRQKSYLLEKRIWRE